MSDIQLDYPTIKEEREENYAPVYSNSKNILESNLDRQMEKSKVDNNETNYVIMSLNQDFFE